MSELIYDAKTNLLWIGTYRPSLKKWELYYEDDEVQITAFTRRGLFLPTDQLFKIGTL